MFSTFKINQSSIADLLTHSIQCMKCTIIATFTLHSLTHKAMILDLYYSNVLRHRL